MRYSSADLNLRAGKGVASEARIPLRLASTRRRALLLIHGFNVNEREALTALGRFRDELGKVAPVIAGDIFILTWAGNWTLPVFRPAAYPFMLTNAKESAETLHEFIAEWYRTAFAPDDLIIVAHSLGCRLVLEAMKKLDGSRPQTMRRLFIILMAAAVPTGHVGVGGDLSGALSVADHVAIMHSLDDSVLSLVFGVGQTLAGDGWWPEAVGLRGEPVDARWGSSNCMEAFGHGDYWSETETVNLVCRLLGIVTPLATPGHSLADRRYLRKYRSVISEILPVYRGR